MRPGRHFRVQRGMVEVGAMADSSSRMLIAPRPGPISLLVAVR